MISTISTATTIVIADWLYIVWCPDVCSFSLFVTFEQEGMIPLGSTRTWDLGLQFNCEISFHVLFVACPFSDMN